MRVAIYGDAHRPGSGGSCYAEALRELGHEVVCIRNDQNLSGFYRSLPGRALNALLGRPLEHHRKQHMKPVLAAVARERPEIVIILKGLLVSGLDVEAMRSTGAWVVIINHDDFFSLNPRNWSKLQRRALPHYDYVFATREVNVHEVSSINPRVELLAFAYSPAIHRPVGVPEAERDRWSTDVLFVGTWEADRCALLEQLVREVPARYAIYGTGWQHVAANSPLQKFIHGHAIVTDEMAKAIGGAKISLAFLRKKNRDEYTQRTFEIPACNGVLLAERTPAHTAYYREGVEAEFFNPDDPAELTTKVRVLLGDEARREALRSAGREAVLRGRHTYRDRMEQMLAVHRQKAARTPRSE